MSVENPASDNDCESGKVNGNKNEHVNGIHNGYSSSDKHKSSHKSSSKDKHRDKDRDHKSSSKHSSSSSRDKDKDRHSSSKSHSSSHKSSSKDKDRSDRDKDRHEKSKDEASSKDRDRSDKDKHRSDKDKHRDKDRSDKERSDRDKDRHKIISSEEKKSSSKDKDRDHKSSSSKEHKSKDRDKDREKDRHRSDKLRSDKDRHSSSKDKHGSSKSKEKSRDEKSEKIKSEPQDWPVKEEPMQVDIPQFKQEIKEESDDGYAPNNTTASSCDYSLSQFKDDPLADLPPDEESGEEETPLSDRKASKRQIVEDSEEDIPLLLRKKSKKKVKKETYDDDDEEEEKPKKKKIKTEKTKTKPNKVKTDPDGPSPTKRKKKEDEQEVWKWWEEEKKDDGTKWSYLEHKGPLFAPPYEPLPEHVKFRYDGKVIRLSEAAEEVAGFYARMLEHDYMAQNTFNHNFFNDWRKVMTHEEAKMIKDLAKCDFKDMHNYFQSVSEKNKNRSKEEKAAIKTKNEEIQKEYGFCTIDGHKEKIGNFRIEPPGLFKGRGEHPKTGMLKKRITPEDVSINCSKDSVVPKPPSGHKWKDVRHDNTVTWLASWTENVQGNTKYVMLNPSSKLKGEKDWQKYETARKLHKCIDKIRENYRSDWKAKEMRVRQRAVALYFIDRLALRAGNEKDDDQADTVGCCSLRVEHIELHKEKDGKEYVVVFDFPGKDSIRYYNEVPVEKRVFKNLELFMESKKGGDDLFDRLNTQTLNDHLKDLMPALTAKVFRTYNASITLQRQLEEITDPDATVPEKILAYNRANRAVAILCNHQRAVPKSHSKSMEALKEKIQGKRDQIDEAEADVRETSKAAKRGSVKEKLAFDKKKKALERLKQQLKKLELQETDRDENKSIALSTSKLNYIDPRISVAWCKKHDVPISKIYNKTQSDKFRWAIDMAGPDFIF